MLTLPYRWNELFGLQHMKLYIFDDTLVISGANLSNDYFTNRQDRYYVIKDKKLTDFYCGLVKKVQSFSLQLDKNDNVRLGHGWKHLPYKGSRIGFVEEARNLVRNFILDATDEQNIDQQSGHGKNNCRNTTHNKTAERRFVYRHVGVSFGSNGPTSHRTGCFCNRTFVGACAKKFPPFYRHRLF